jgi:hypothetical protein
MLLLTRDRAKTSSGSGLGAFTLRAAGLRALAGGLFVAGAVGALGYSQAAANQDDCKSEHASSKARKACKSQATEQQHDALWTAVAAGGAVVVFRFGGEGLYDRRRQDRGLGPKLGDVQW